jgi:hypothetical protein
VRWGLAAEAELDENGALITDAVIVEDEPFTGSG